LEIDGIDRARGILPPMNLEMIGHQYVGLSRQGSLEMVKKLTEIRPCLRFARCRPQHKSQPFARLRRIAMKDEICDQGMEAVRVDSRDRAIREGDPQVAEQVYPHRFCLVVYDVSVAKPRGSHHSYRFGCVATS
jgi:hypothetical protein